MKKSTSHTWLRGAVIYQIYPRSFKDAGKSGIGNLKGIISKLDYLAGTEDSLGVTGLWLSPINPSPMADFGYDVSDYTDIEPLFGDLEDLKSLVKEAHARNLKVLMDFVPNHTSNEHAWFKESSASIDNSKREWYTWKDPKADGSPPNNWLSVFGGSAWQFSETTKQYYLHSFLAEQPDLNWDNPEVREAMKSAMCFWLDIGVDGFRVDAVDWLSKDSKLRNDPRHPHVSQREHDQHYSLQHRYSRDGPHLFERLDEMAAVLAEYDGRFMILEAHPEKVDTLEGFIEYYENIDPQYSAPFNFESIYLPWQAKDFQRQIKRFNSLLKPEYVPVNTIGNHDESRVASRIGIDAARTAALMIMTLPGVSFIYYGEEIGMIDVPIKPQQIRDPSAIYGKSRDPERTPMLWNNDRNAGFSNGTPWLPLSPDFNTLNVESQEHDRTSFLSLYKILIAYRKQSIPIQQGLLKTHDIMDDILCYELTFKDQSIIVLLNFSDKQHHVSIKNLKGTLRLSTYLDTQDLAVTERILLRPHEGVIIERT
jgi:alpha-glucosidase